ncbi:MAG: Hsp20/alpha crystallin family protein [Bacilli bacterium]|nr:Hsp20/alpha crystallin family protein [Bacilli bacterium]
MGFLPSKFYLDDFFEDSLLSRKGIDMKCDIFEKDGNINIEMDVPGYSKEDIKIDFDNDYLTIEATKESKNDSEEKNYIRKERFYGSVKRQFYVGNIDEDKIRAKFEDGVLKISFPKEEVKKQKNLINID